MKSIQSILAGDFFTQLQQMHQEMQTVQKEVGWALETQHISAQLCYLKSFEHGEMILCATSSAACFRIRQILPTLHTILNQKGVKVESIKVLNR